MRSQSWCWAAGRQGHYPACSRAIVCLLVSVAVPKAGGWHSGRQGWGPSCPGAAAFAPVGEAGPEATALSLSGRVGAGTSWGWCLPTGGCIFVLASLDAGP